jgi:hypothetical protein
VAGFLFGGGGSNPLGVKNVKSFGATGDGITDDSAAIQAAVNWTSGANRGVIYFPAGSYYVGTTPITFNYDGNLSICFRGRASHYNIRYRRC